jgi:hypothetical protein
MHRTVILAVIVIAPPFKLPIGSFRDRADLLHSNIKHAQLSMVTPLGQLVAFQP